MEHLNSRNPNTCFAEH